MFLGITDKAADISHKSVVPDMSIHSDYIVKALILDLSETEERYMLTCVPLLSGRRGMASERSVTPSSPQRSSSS